MMLYDLVHKISRRYGADAAKNVLRKRHAFDVATHLHLGRTKVDKPGRSAQTQKHNLA